MSKNEKQLLTKNFFISSNSLYLNLLEGGSSKLVSGHNYHAETLWLVLQRMNIKIYHYPTCFVPVQEGVSKFSELCVCMSYMHIYTYIWMDAYICTVWYSIYRLLWFCSNLINNCNGIEYGHNFISRGYSIRHNSFFKFSACAFTFVVNDNFKSDSKLSNPIFYWD